MSVVTLLSSGFTWADVNSQIGVNGKPDILFDYGAIENSISNILTCPLGSRGWHPTFGSNVPQLLWEPCDFITANQIKAATITALRRWEPRITLVAGKSSVVPLPDGTGYTVTLVYQVNVTSTPRTTVFQLTR